MAIERKALLIEGMTCVNCQNRIEQALRNIAGISKVYVSYSKGQAEIEFDNDILTLDRIIAVIQNLDYKVVKKRKKDYSEFVNWAVTFAIIILLYCLLQRFGILNLLVPSMLADSKMSYGMLFIVGLLTSVHCIAMCGGINLSQCIPVADDDNGKTPKNKIILPSLLYNTGRVISYSVIGFLLGGMGMLLTGGGGMGIPLLLQGILKIIAGLFMVIMGINMLGWIPLLRKFQIRFPQRLADKINKKRRRENRLFFVGLLNGLMPCGPMQSMQIIALGSGNPISGAAAMLMFSLGTVPLMLGFGSIFSALGKKFTRQILKTGAILVVVMGLAMMSQGSALSGFGSRSGEKAATEADNVQDNDQTDTAVEKDGVQYVSSILRSGRYPDITVKAGEPVKWEIQVPEGSINGCNYKMILQDFGRDHTFENGENVIEFIPEKEGVYTYSCWMGMITGTIYVTGK